MELVSLDNYMWISEKSLSTISREGSILSETQRIELYIEKYLPKSTHPFVNDCVAQNGEIYCKGNLAIAHLNLACNGNAWFVNFMTK